MITKYTSVERILDVKESSAKLETDETSALSKYASLVDSREDTNEFLYVRARAISSRVNKNNDGWPSNELSKSYKSFIGRPIFVDHNNDNPDRTRGVIVDAKLHVEDDDKTSALDPYYATAPDSHKPPTWIELLLEVDKKTFPKLAHAVKTGHIDAVSMGANIDYSDCSICGNRAKDPTEYCDHIKSKGAEFEIVSSSGEKQMKKAYEECGAINFFEISFVFDPADPTALISEKKGSFKEAEYQYIKKRGDKWVVLQKGTGKVLSTHDSYEKAVSSFKAMMMHKHEGKVAYDPYATDDTSSEFSEEGDYGNDDEQAYEDQLIAEFDSALDEGDEERARDVAFEMALDEREDRLQAPNSFDVGDDFEEEVQSMPRATSFKGGKGHQPDCACGFCERMRDNMRKKQDKETQFEEALDETFVESSNSCPECKSSNLDKILKEAWDNDNLYKCLDCKKNFRKKSNDLMEPYDQELDEGSEEFGEPPVNPREPDSVKVPRYRTEQLTQAGFPPELAQAIGERWYGEGYIDLHAAIDLVNRGASPDQVWQILSSVNEISKLAQNGWPLDELIRAATPRKIAWTVTADPRDIQEHGTEADRQVNYEPQSEMTSAPTEVDTLRKDPTCKNCKSGTLKSDPDGLMKCNTCGWTAPPNPLDTPDLSVHQRLDADTREDASGGMPSVDELLRQIKITPSQGAGDMAQQPYKSHTTESRINRMTWNTISNVARVDAFIENKDGINVNTYNLLKDNGLSAKVTYPDGETTHIPFDSPVKDMMLSLRAQKAAGLADSTEVPVSIEASYKDISDVLEIIQTGRLEKKAAPPPRRKVINPNVPTKTDDPQNAKVVSDQKAPITSSEEVEEVVEPKEEKSSNIFEAMALAKELIALNALDPDDELVFVAEYEDKSDDRLAGAREILALVKEAGLRKGPKVSQASFPRMAAFRSEPEIEDQPFEQYFL